MWITRRSCSAPSNKSYGPGISRAFCRTCASAGDRVRVIRLLLPEPLTPVMQTKVPNGKATSTDLRLCSRAPRSWCNRSEAQRGRRCR